MQITNKYGLPSVLVNLLHRDDYSRGDANISVTSLIDSPRRFRLKEAFKSDITVDVVDQVWSLFGRAVHAVLEKGAGDEHISEERITVEIDGWRLSGAIDLQTIVPGGRRISDYKVTSSYGVMSNKSSWEMQLNLYRWLVETFHGITVTDLEIIAIVRDWNRNLVGTKDGYPEAPIVSAPIPMWTMKQAEDFVHLRLAQHKEALNKFQWGDELPDCTAEDQWLKDGQWAVYQEGRKRASRVFGTQEEAEAHAATLKDASVVHRPGEPTRCASFCEVAEHCTQYQHYLKTKGDQE